MSRRLAFLSGLLLCGALATPAPARDAPAAHPPGVAIASGHALATEAGFEVGTRTTVDVLDARRRLFEAQRDYARSRYDYLINLVRLKSAAGVLAPADLESINSFLTTPTTLPVRPRT